MRLFIILLMIQASCATKSGTLNLEKEGRVTRLDENFGTLARLGKTPIPVPKFEMVARYALKTSGRPTEFLMVVEPYLVNGEIRLPTISSNQYIESASQNHQYFDLLLRAQRQIAKGDYEGPTNILEKLDELYDVTFGTYLLSAKIAVIRGNMIRAHELYQKAFDLYQDSEQLKKILQ